MKKLLLLAISSLVGFTSMAQVYESTAIYSQHGTNLLVTTTNLGAVAASSVITVTKHDNFGLSIYTKGSNANNTANLAVTWQISGDGTTWPTYINQAGVAGWFSVPLSNAANGAMQSVYFVTNITAPANGYWRINWLTNESGIVITNLVIKKILKPVIDGR